MKQQDNGRPRSGSAFRRRLILAAPALAAMAPAALRAQPADWKPTGPMRLVVPYPPGGGNDIIARIISTRLSERLGQSAVIENKPGAAGMIGSEQVYRAAPDGHTLLVANGDTHSINPHVYANIRYNASEFGPAAGIALSDFVVVGRPDLGASTMKELVDLSGRTELTCGSHGIGSGAHVIGETMKRRHKMQLLHVPYPGSAPAIAALMGGQIDILVTPISLAIANRARVKILGVAADRRSQVAPDMISLGEQGFPLGLGPVWIGLMAPPKTAPAVLATVNRIVNEMFQEPAGRERLSSLGLQSFSPSVAEFAAYLADDYKRWGDAVRQANIRMDLKS